MNEEDDGLGLINYRIKNIEEKTRINQLQLRKPEMLNPPKLNSICDLQFLEPNSSLKSPFTMPKRSMSLTEFKSISVPYLNTEEKDSNYDSENNLQGALDILKQMCDDVPVHYTRVLTKIVEKGNINFNEILTKETLFPLSAFLQSHKNKRALVIVPSKTIGDWVRMSINESSGRWPEGRNEQNKTISQMKSGKTQIIICIPKLVSSVPTILFDVIYVLKSELCDISFPFLTNCSCPVVYHQSPGYLFNPRSRMESIYVEREIICTPEVIYSDDFIRTTIDYVDSRDDEMRTIVLCPFSNILELIIRGSNGRIKNLDLYKEDNSFYGATKTVLYGNYHFDRYIFVGFPIQLELLLMACITCRSVVVTFDLTIAQKLQIYSHQTSIDMSTVKSLMELLFWSTSNKTYKGRGDISLLSFDDIDCDLSSSQKMIYYLTLKKLIRPIPFNASNGSIKIISMLEDMEKNPILRGILSLNKTNVNGQINFNIHSLCNQLKVLPSRLDIDLQHYVDIEAITLRFSGEANYFEVRHVYDDKNFLATVLKITEYISKEEEELHKKFDICYTLLTNPECIKEYYECEFFTKKKFRTITPIPTNPLNLEVVKSFLRSTRNGSWTPRAITRILMGMNSPLFPASRWQNNQYWAKQQGCSFYELMKILKDSSCRAENIKIRS